MLFLPPVVGRYAVGATAFVTPVRPTCVYGSAKRRKVNGSSTDQLEHVLCMEEVGFTVYYPADISSADRKGFDWLLRPAEVSLLGYSFLSAIPTWIMWFAIYLYGVLVKIPVYANAPLLQSASLDKSEPVTGQWPLLIFSHGLGGSRTAYSHLCARLAASGKVVIAIEHRDGTAHACITRSWSDQGHKVPRPIYYLNANQAVWEDQPLNDASAAFPLRIEQLEFRRKEIYTAYTVFCDYMRGEVAELETTDGSVIHDSWRMADKETNRGPIKYFSDVTLIGHSFGGCTMLSILSTPPPSGHEHIPITQTLVLDPWLEPLPAPGPVPHLRRLDNTNADGDTLQDDTTITDASLSPLGRNPDLPRMLVINSETFTLWEEHFSRLQQVVRAWEPKGKRIITLVGSKHQSFSDFPILPFIKTRDSLKLHDLIANASLAFLDSNFEQYIEETLTREMEAFVIGVKPNGKPKRKLRGVVGDMIVH